MILAVDLGAEAGVTSEARAEDLEARVEDIGVRVEDSGAVLVAGSGAAGIAVETLAAMIMMATGIVITSQTTTKIDRIAIEMIMGEKWPKFGFYCFVNLFRGK